VLLLGCGVILVLMAPRNDVAASTGAHHNGIALRLYRMNPAFEAHHALVLCATASTISSVVRAYVRTCACVRACVRNLKHDELGLVPLQLTPKYSLSHRQLQPLVQHEPKSLLAVSLLHHVRPQQLPHLCYRLASWAKRRCQ
jgi:hypothetical protein